MSGYRLLATSCGLYKDFVDDAVFDGFLGRHEEIPIDILLYLLQLLAGVLGEYLIEARAYCDYLLGGDLDVGGLAFGAT